MTHALIGGLTSSDVSLRKDVGGIVNVGEFLDTWSSASGLTIAATTGDDINNFTNTGLEDYVEFLPGDSTASDRGTIRQVDLDGYKSNGLSTFAVTFSASHDPDVSGDVVVQTASLPSSVVGEVEVTYIFSPIPEPSVALLGGLGILGLLRRRRSPETV